jgi:hypothetical protein
MSQPLQILFCRKGCFAAVSGCGDRLAETMIKRISGMITSE